METTLEPTLLGEPETADYLATNKTPTFDANSQEYLASLQSLDLSLIRPSPNNPRTEFDQGELEELAGSIKRHGVLQPISVRLVVRLDLEGGTAYEIIAGERRFRASKMAGLTHIPALVREVESDADALELALVENLDRADISVIEKAAGFHALTRLGWHQDKIAARFRISQPVIANTLRLMKLPEPVQAMIRERKLSGSHGLALLPALGFVGDITYSDPEPRFATMAEQLAASAVEEGWSVKALTAEVERRFPKAAEGVLLDVPAQPSGATNFVAPEPAPLSAQGDALSAQGDMTDAEWEASATNPANGKVNDEGGDQVSEGSEHDLGEAGGTAPDRVAADVSAGTEGAPSADEVSHAPDAGIVGAAEAPAQAPGAAVSALDASEPEEPVSGVDGGDAGDVSAPDTQRGATPAPPVAAKPAAPAPAPPSAPAPPPLPPGMMRAVISEAAYEALEAAGLWPIEYAVEELEILRAKASMPMHPEAIKAGELLEKHILTAETLMPPEVEILHELYPDRNIVTWVMLASAMLIRRARYLQLPANTDLAQAAADISLDDPVDSAVNITPTETLADEEDATPVVDDPETDTRQDADDQWQAFGDAQKEDE